MKKTVIVNIPMTIKMDPVVYVSKDLSVPATNRAVHYPVCAFLEKTLKPEDDVKFVLLAKDDSYSNWEKSIDVLKEDLTPAVAILKKAPEYHIIKTNFSEEGVIHNQLMGEIADMIDAEDHIVADITYGPKDLPIVLFAALNFAEKHLGAEIDNILYGQVNYENNQVVNPRIWDMSPLFYLNSVSDAVHCEDPVKAKELLKTLLSI